MCEDFFLFVFQMLAQVHGEPQNPDSFRKLCCGCVRKVSGGAKGAVVMGGFTGRAGREGKKKIKKPFSLCFPRS